MYIQNNNPSFRLAKLSENGGFPQLSKRWRNIKTSCGQAIEFEPLGFENLLFAFFVLGTAHIGALFIMRIEIFMSSRSKKSKYVHSQEEIYIKEKKIIVNLKT